MNFHENINKLVESFKETQEYKEYLDLKENLKKNNEVYNMLKDFKEKQNEVQISYLNGKDISKEKQQEMEILECEMKINIILADLQKSMGEAIEELVKF